MKRILVALAFVLAAWANADAYLIVPTSRGANLPLCLEGIGVAKDNGYDGVIFGAGTLNIPNVSDNGVHRIEQAASYADYRIALREVFKKGLKAHVRLGVGWSGSGSVRPFRPDPWAWPYIARIWTQTKNYTDVEAKAAGISGSSRVTFELCNEPGLAGANGPQFGYWSTARIYYDRWKKYGDKADWLKAFPDSLFGKPEGYIEPEFGTMMWNIRRQASFGGYKTFGVNFEGDWEAEFLSIQGADWQNFFSWCHGYSLNRYGGDARSVWFYENGKWGKRPATPDEMAQRWAENVAKKLGWAKAMPVLQDARFLTMVCEAGFFDGYAATGWTPNDYRQAIIRKGKSFPNLKGAGLFTYKATDPLGTGYEVGAGVIP